MRSFLYTIFPAKLYFASAAYACFFSISVIIERIKCCWWVHFFHNCLIFKRLHISMILLRQFNMILNYCFTQHLLWHTWNYLLAHTSDSWLWLWPNWSLFNRFAGNMKCEGVAINKLEDYNVLVSHLLVFLSSVWFKSL